MLTPVFWLSLFNLSTIGKEIINSSRYLSNNLKSIVSPDNSKNIDELRWVDDRYRQNNLIGKLFYNKGMVIINEFGNYLAFVSPRFYFQAGDGSKLSPKNVEPTSLLLYPFWIVGVIFLIKSHKYKSIIMACIFAFIAFLLGQRNFFFLLPITLIYLYIANVGIDQIKKVKTKKIIVMIMIIYSLYILSRAIFI